MPSINSALVYKWAHVFVQYLHSSGDSSSSGDRETLTPEIHHGLVTLLSGLNDIFINVLKNRMWNSQINLSFKFTLNLQLGVVWQQITEGREQNMQAQFNELCSLLLVHNDHVIDTSN